MGIVTGVVLFVRAMFIRDAAIAAENLALRHQLGVLERSVQRPRLRRRDRIFWVWLSWLWPDWREAIGNATARAISPAAGQTSRRIRIGTFVMATNSVSCPFLWRPTDTRSAAKSVASL